MKNLKLILLLSFLSINFLFSESIKDKNFGEVRVKGITSIYDGDTFRCNIEGYPDIIGYRIGIRIYGIDTPEMRDKRPKIKALARKAKQYTVRRLREGKVIMLKNMKRGKYFRIVAEVWIDGSNLAEELIKEGLAKEYFGGKKIKWE